MWLEFSKKLRNKKNPTTKQQKTTQKKKKPKTTDSEPGPNYLLSSKYQLMPGTRMWRLQ